LENLICYLIAKISGISISHRNTLNSFLTEEIDIAFWNERNPKGLYFLPNIFLVECKNWSVPVSSMEVNWFASKLENRGLDHGILFATKGITGHPEELSRAHHIISTHLAKQRRIIVITRIEIEQLSRTEELINLMKRKLCQLAVSGTII
ncbi:MAG: hypothetical protein NTY36_10750, partial [Deltaproteobacteria bacterium]|nr:hypothetical protein [Deltaproteobacteria bacterium]